ncbi:RBBP9/YdeN family alpha/beta hydrolase [Ramlibacter rhizophilus]|uniref:Alpha/beta hydrolase n=1 Tax=Ramlibacter rhizophilus TaxID=1781167 RepID=A0A4Z0BHP8_9BURK|nr:alpha/beta hydrolase [Ramlibacter rhizophilus]TFY97993.1 alpha/beta hydrolase [Ramlibacter rhizophilus]
MRGDDVLLLPGWQNSGPGHWQTLWEQQHGCHRVEQHDWLRPLRGDWIARLEEVLLARRTPAVLAAHSLGCHLVAAWAAHSRHTDRVRGALLVAPPDIERPELRTLLPSWAPTPRQALGFPSVLVAGRDDPYGDFEQAQCLARDWGARLEDLGPAGHVNADSGLGDWPQGWSLLQALAGY